MKLYSGDMLVRNEGIKYLVAHTDKNKFQIISMADGNRWTNDGHETESERTQYGSKLYITSDQISGIFGEFTVLTKEERYLAEENNKVCDENLLVKITVLNQLVISLKKILN
jgi:hypothetical protein